MGAPGTGLTVTSVDPVKSAVTASQTASLRATSEYIVFDTGVTGIVKEALPVPVAVAPLLSVSVQAPDAVTVPIISVDAPAQTDVLAELMLAAGLAETATEGVVWEQPGAALFVNVNVADPCAMPVTRPVAVTLAMAGLLLTQVPPVLGVKLNVLPTQTEVAEVIAGRAITLTARFTVLTHPLILVTV